MGGSLLLIKKINNKILLNKLMVDSDNILIIKDCDQKVLFKLNKFLIKNDFVNEILLKCDNNPIYNTSKVYFEEYVVDGVNQSSKFCSNISTKFKTDYAIVLKCKKEEAWGGLGNQHYVLQLNSKSKIVTLRGLIRNNV